MRGRIGSVNDLSRVFAIIDNNPARLDKNRARPRPPCTLPPAGFSLTINPTRFCYGNAVYGRGKSISPLVPPPPPIITPISRAAAIHYSPVGVERSTDRNKRVEIDKYDDLHPSPSHGSGRGERGGDPRAAEARGRVSVSLEFGEKINFCRARLRASSKASRCSRRLQSRATPFSETFPCLALHNNRVNWRVPWGHGRGGG